MSYQITLTINPSYIHAIIVGENSRENVMNYMREIREKCESSGIFRILIEEHLEGPRLGTIDVFQIVREGSEKNRGLIREIAYVDMNASGDLMKFAETVARNRGLRMKAFNNIQDAENWLQGSE